MRLVVKGLGEVEVDWATAQLLIAELKALGFRFDPTAKAWEPPRVLKAKPSLRLLKYFPRAAELPRGYYQGNYYVYAGEEPKDLAYKLKMWRRATCEEYCEERCGEDSEEETCDSYCEKWCSKNDGDDACVEYCAERCRDEGWLEERRSRCVEQCTERCEEEGWRPVVQDEVVVKLYWPAGSGLWKVPRGLAAKLGARERFLERPIAHEPDDALRPYQREVAKSVFEAFERYGGAVAQMATGAGKSYMAGYIARELARNGYKVLVTALSKDLVVQLQDFARRWGAEVHAATVQWLWRRVASGDREPAAELDEEEREVVKAYSDEWAEEGVEKLLDARDVAIVIDETHHVPARTVREVVKAVGGGWALRLGLSATPWRADGRDMEIEAWVGPIVEPRISSSYLIEHGYAVPITIYMHRPKAKCKTPDGSYAEVRKVLLLDCEERNREIIRILMDAEKPAMVVTSLVKHAELLYKMAKEAGLRAELATGAVKAEERKRIFDAVRARQVDVLVATTIANEGLDLPSLRTLVNARGGASPPMAIQVAGRLVRKDEGKDHATLIDFCDDAPFFREQCEKRAKIYATEPRWNLVWT